MAVFYLSLSLLIAVPLTITTAVYRVYVIPRFALLLVGSASLLPLMLLSRVKGRNPASTGLLKSRHILLVCSYFVVVSISTLFGAAPLSSLFGSVYNQMGLMTHLCFFVVFLSLIVGVNSSETRLRVVLWAMVLAGFMVALYAVLQFFGIDPLVPPVMYTVNSATGSEIRVNGTLGHSNYLGNFLLYTTPLSTALAFAANDRRRYFALSGVLLSIAAIVCSGTRGAWLGLAGGAGTLVLYLFGDKHRRERIRAGLTLRRTAFAFGVVALLVLGFSSSAASGTIADRFRSFAADGFTGSGRTLLWRDSFAMLPHLPLTGGGPESFRKQFLAFKSGDLARLSPLTNNESSHNSFLDAVISYGLPGAILYIAIIVSTFTLLVRARRRAAVPEMKLIITGLIASLIAVVVHNCFTYDQISTGLYFFALVSLAQIATAVASNERFGGISAQRRRNSRKVQNDSRPGIRADHSSTVTGGKAGTGEEKSSRLSSSRIRWLSLAVGAGFCVSLGAVWYSLDLFRSDMHIKAALVSAGAGRFDDMVRHCELATQSAEPTGNYQFLFISLLAESASKSGSGHSQEESRALRVRALELAVANSGRPLAHTLTPELDNLLLAYLAWAAGDMEKTTVYAGEVLRWDKNNSEGCWLMADALAARGNREGAATWAELALELNPGSREAKSALRLARTGSAQHIPKKERLMKR